MLFITFHLRLLASSVKEHLSTLGCWSFAPSYMAKAASFYMYHRFGKLFVSLDNYCASGSRKPAACDVARNWRGVS